MSVRKGHSTVRELIKGLLWLGLIVPVASAQDSDPLSIPTSEKPWRLTFQLENDSAMAKPNHNTDRHYTNGAKITLAYHPQWADDIATWLEVKPDSESGMLTAGGLFLGQNIYTPDRIDNPARRSPDDRVFAGWLYVGAFWQHEADNELNHVELNLGVVGEVAKSDSTQRWIHETFDAVDPIGWENQLGNELGVNLTLRHKWKIELPALSDSFDWELIPQGGVTLGTIQRNATLGALIRLGENLPPDFGPARIVDPAAATRNTGTNTPGWYVFARVGAKLVAYDRFLSGVDPEPLLGEVQIGFQITWKKLRLGYSQTFMTQEFETQIGTDSFGAWVLSYTHHF